MWCNFPDDVILFRRASSLNLSLEKLAEPPNNSTKLPRAESLERQAAVEGKPPPKPPHTYYNKHRYPANEEAQTTGKWTQLLACHLMLVILTHHLLCRFTESPESTPLCSSASTSWHLGPSHHRPLPIRGWQRKVKAEHHQEAFHQEIKIYWSGVWSLKQNRWSK